MTSLRVALLQLPAPDRARAEAAWEEALRRIDDAARDEPHLVVLPEASYPGWLPGVAEPALTESVLVPALQDRARRHGMHIAAGLVLNGPQGPQNAAVLLSPEGEIARTGEAAPPAWFRPGRGPVAAQLLGLRAALIAGGDLLDSRWVEAIAESGTQLLISTGAARGSLRGGVTSGDLDFVIASRAIEIGAWVVSASRVGVEGQAVTYIGGAGVVSPQGRWAVRAPADRHGIVLHTLEVGETSTRTRSVPDLTAPEAPSTEHGTTRLATLAIDPGPSAVELMEAVRASIRTASALGVRLAVLPDLTGADPRAVTQTELLPLLETLSAETQVSLAVALAERADGALYRTVSLIEDGQAVAHHRQTALSEQDRAVGYSPGTKPPPVVATRSAGVLGLLAGEEGVTLAAAASLRRRGAQAIAWCANAGGYDALAVTRTRAWEQRRPVVAASPRGAFIVERGGHVLAATSEGAAMLAHARVNLLPNR